MQNAVNFSFTVTVIQICTNLRDGLCIGAYPPKFWADGPLRPCNAPHFAAGTFSYQRGLVFAEREVTLQAISFSAASRDSSFLPLESI